MQKYLIVGGGLAGCCLALQLAEQGCKVSVIDNGKNVSSRIAAGMINPLVFRRMTKSWRVDEFIPYAKEFYAYMEEITYSRFFHDVTIRRFFSSEQERNFWINRQDRPDFSEYITPITAEDETVEPFANQFGSGRVINSYYLNTAELLDGFKKLPLIEFFEEEFDYSIVDAQAGIYKNEQYDGIVFCEGYQSKFNPWFSAVPVNSTKGETLLVETNDLSQTESYNRKCFTLHLGNGQFRVGATYVWHTDDTELTQEGKETLLGNLAYLTNQDVKVVEQKAGVRPTTMDRRPVMGRHKLYNRMAIFNGLGTKGYMMAPLLSKEMAEYLLKGTSLNKECSIERFDY